MNTPVHGGAADAPADLVELLAAAEVVVFVSGLTDIRSLRVWLDEYACDYRVVQMGMDSFSERERFHRLRTWTGWPLLPQVFVHGTFVGGAEEFFASDYARARCP